MEIIFNNQPIIFEDILSIYLTPKQCVKFYSSNKLLYNIYLKHNKFESNYFTPRSKEELYLAVNDWYTNRKETKIKYGYISFWNTIYITHIDHLYHHKYNSNIYIREWNMSNVILFTNC